jgi:UDP-glucuronate decarboxylase
MPVKRFKGKTVMITGAAGFLGRHLTKKFRELGARVYPLDNYITGAEHVDEIMTADVTAPTVFDGPLHFILHAAGIASPVFYAKHPLETIDVAVKGTRNMLVLATMHPELEGFLYFSSSEIYGDPNVVPTPEDYRGNVSCTGPRACYDESKRLGETLCSVYHKQYGVPVRTVRPFNIFGPGMSHNDRRVVPMFTYEAMHDRPLPLFRDGLQTRTFCYIEDALMGFLRVVLDGRVGEAYNIGNPNPEISMKELALMFHDFFPDLDPIYELKPYPGEYPADEPLRRCPDVSKAVDDLGFYAKWTLAGGLLEFVEWAQGQPAYLA